MRKGFTLIELLIVIGILAVLATITVLVLNPAEILAQARDSQRLADLKAVSSAISLHLATGNAPDVNFGGTGTIARCTVSAGVSPFTATGNGCGSGSAVSSTVITGAGWVTVNFADVSGGSPAISRLPLDPLSNSNYFYAYAATDNGSPANVFELDARLESSKYKAQMTTDGGNKNTCSTYTEDTCYYELGTSLTQ
jgi:prepilin-type N-terminal cleavage/methylation domain-containing protein